MLMMTPYHDGYHHLSSGRLGSELPLSCRISVLPGRYIGPQDGSVDYVRGVNFELHPHLSPGFITLLMLVVRKSSNSVRGPVFYCLLHSRVSHYGHMADSVAPCAARQGLRGCSGWPLATFNTRTGDSFRRPI